MYTTNCVWDAQGKIRCAKDQQKYAPLVREHFENEVRIESRDGRCGPSHDNKRCPPNQCCSVEGLCGSGEAYCVNYKRNDSLYDGVKSKDCIMSDWGAWGMCMSDGDTCGNGIKKRYRTIVANPEHGGKPCESLEDTMKCVNLNNCPKEGASIKCKEDERTSDWHKVYRFTDGLARHYPNQKVADSWNMKWSDDIKTIKCKNLMPLGDPMDYKPMGYTSKGCWGDTWDRAMPVVEGKYPILDGKYWERKDALRKCYTVAEQNGHKYFGLQNGGHCQVGSTEDYKKYGPSSACKNGLGGPWANDVYEVTYSKN